MIGSRSLCREKACELFNLGVIARVSVRPRVFACEGWEIQGDVMELKSWLERCFFCWNGVFHFRATLYIHYFWVDFYISKQFIPLFNLLILFIFLFIKNISFFKISLFRYTCNISYNYFNINHKYDTCL